MILNSALLALTIFIMGLIWKASSSHSDIKLLKAENLLLKTNYGIINDRINSMCTDFTRIHEALDRTFVSKEYLYDEFVTRKDHDISVARLEERLVSKMEHINETLMRIDAAIDKG